MVTRGNLKSESETGSSGSTSHAQAAKKLSIKYNRMILLSTLALIAFIFGLGASQYSRERSMELQDFGLRLANSSATLETSLKSVSAQITRMAMWAGDYMGMHAHQQPYEKLRDLLEYDSQGNYFRLDRLEPPYTRVNSGNIVGLGTVEGNSDAFYSELDMALALFRLQSMVRELIPYVERTYYVSDQGFIASFPWVVSPDSMKLLGSPMNEAFAHLYQQQCWEQGLPKNNPDRKLFFTAAYVDAGLNKQIVTVGFPVYEGDRFLGVLAADLTVGILNGFVQQLGFGRGQLILIESNGQVLGDSGWTGTDSIQFQMLSDVLPKEIADKSQEVVQLTKTSRYLSGYNVLVRRLDATPWSLIYVLPETALVQRLFPYFWVFALVTLGLAAFLVSADIVIRRQFVNPAISMAEFIETKARDGKAPIPYVPAQWNPWFEGLSETFKFKQVQRHLHSFMESVSGFVVYQLEFNKESPGKSRVVFVSPSIKDVMDIPHPYKFETWFENVHPEDRENLTQASMDSITQSSPFDCTWRTYHWGRNEWVWIHATATPVFDPDERLTYFNGLIIDVTDRIRAESDLEKELVKFQALYDLATAMTAERSLDKNLSQLVEKSRELLQSDMSYIGLFDESAQVVYVRTWSGLLTDAVKTLKIPLGQGLAGRVMETNRPYIVKNYYEDVEPIFHELARLEGIVSGMATPINMGGNKLGVFIIYNRSSKLFLESDVTTLSLLGNLAAVAIFRNRVERELQKVTEELEQRVEERTAQLVVANEKLNQEIWERKAAEQALAASEETLRVIFNGTRDSIFIHDVNGKILDVNDQMLETYLVTREEALTFTIEHDYSSEENAKDQLPQMWQEVLIGKNQYFEWKARRPHDGSSFDADVFLCKLSTKLGDFILANVHDITHRRRAEDELKYEKAYAEQLFESSPDAIAVLDLNDHVSRINPAFTKLFGYLESDALGRTLNELVATADRMDEAQADSEAIRSSDTIDVDVVRKKKDGSLVDVSVVGSSINIDGNRVGFFEIYRDNSDHTKNLQALRQSEELYRALVESIPYGISEMDTKGFITFVNSTQARLTGYSKQELIGMLSLDLLADDAQRQAFIAFGTRLLKDQPEPTTWYGTLAMKDGKLVDVEVDWTYKRDPKNHVTGFITIFTDITEKKKADEALRESEEKYRLVVEHSSEGIVILQDSRVKFANQRMVHLMRYSEEEIHSMPLANFVHANDLERAERYLQQVVRGDPIGSHLMFRLLCKDGSALWTQIGAVPISWEGKAGILCFITDMTETRKLQEDLIKIEKLESIGLLAGGIAHDFNNLLTAVLGNLSLARLGLPSSDKRSERLGEAEKACYRVRDLTQQLLAFSKGGAPIKQTVSLIDVAKDSIEFSIRGSQCTGEVSCEENTWPVDVDPGQLGQVFTNLCINACQAMPQGGRIQVNIENALVKKGDPVALALREGRYVKVSVQDHGAGIAQENQPKIFDPYFTTKPKGSGLGLATAYAIIKNHGGLITVDSQVGEGTRFHIYLPASEAVIISKAPFTKPSEQASRGKVLLMDDEESIRNLIMDFLSMLGYEVEISRDGAECVEFYVKSRNSGKPFDVVILDLTVPGGMGGVDAIRSLLEIDPDVKAIVSSGYSDAPIMGEFERYGFQDVIPKPYDVAELCRVIERVMGQAASS